MLPSPGARLGAYEILSALGAGGMGEVYRATDTKLKRQVAIKILPPHLAADPERLARLQREAEVLAILNHPNIAAIYGLEESDGIRALVMELVEGEDLSERLARGPLPIDEALVLAKQLAEGLEAAHDAGVVHRDLKPANIKVRPDRTAKILDFGLARPVPGASATTSADGLSLAGSPTITSPAMLSAAGVILGTAAYMAPEQVRGQATDRRADIWAYGVVLFEMVTGRQLFAEDTLSDTLASVLKSSPDWNRLPPAVPARLRELMRSCLERDPRRRLQAIGDARVQIERILAGEPDASMAKQAPAAPTWRRVLPWALAAACAGAAVVLALRWPSEDLTPPIPLRVDALLGPDLVFRGTQGTPGLALSQDGTQVAFVGSNGPSGPRMIYVRRLDAAHATPLPGTEGAAGPFFSPDGKFIGFMLNGRLKKVAVTGGSPTDLAAALTARGAWWVDDDSIVFAPQRDASLVRLPPGGGAPSSIAALAEGEATHRWPQVLPGARAVLYTASRVPNAAYNEASLVVQPLPAGERRVVLTGGFHGRYVSSGHIVYIHQGTLFARAFDLHRLSVTGPAFAVLEGVASDTNTGLAEFAVSGNGTLVYAPGSSTSEGVDIQWLDRAGVTSSLRSDRANWWNLRFSPDRRRLALQITELTDDIWTLDLANGNLARVTRNAGANTFPVWAPDHRRLAFASTRDDKVPNLYWQPADDSSGATRLTTSPNVQRPGSWDAKGQVLLFDELHPQTQWDLMMLPIHGDNVSGWTPGEPEVLLRTSANEYGAQVSPDGRWLAYVSDETGTFEVYVRPFRRPGGRTKVSAGGGRNPVWSPTSAEILFGVFTPNQSQIMVTSYSTEGESFLVDKPRVWAGGRFQSRGPNRMFDIFPDGTRLAMAPVIQPEDSSRRDHVTFIFNFFEELRRAASK